MSERDKSNHTLTAVQLIAQLLKVHPDTPVVMSQEDEPSGDCGVRSAEICDMKREDTYAAEPFGRDVWHEADWLNEFPNSYSHAHFDPPQQVVFLRQERAHKPVIDAEVAQTELPGMGIIHGDQGHSCYDDDGQLTCVIAKMLQSNGPGWRSLGLTP